MHVHKGLGHLIWFKSNALVIAPGAEGTVIAVALASGGKKGLEQRDSFPTGHSGVKDASLLQHLLFVPGS